VELNLRIACSDGLPLWMLVSVEVQRSHAPLELRDRVRELGVAYSSRRG
jgi:hypothetical protein